MMRIKNIALQHYILVPVFYFVPLKAVKNPNEIVGVNLGLLL